MGTRDRVLLWAAISGFVLLSSLMGLWRPMTAGDGVNWSLFERVWTASIWGDLVFVIGMAGVGVYGVRLVRRSLADAAARHWALFAVPACFLGSWAVYALAWSFTLPGGDAGFLALRFEMFYDSVVGEPRNAWSFVMDEGWLGLGVSALVPPVAGWWLHRQDALHGVRSGDATATTDEVDDGASMRRGPPAA